MPTMQKTEIGNPAIIAKNVYTKESLNWITKGSTVGRIPEISSNTAPIMQRTKHFLLKTRIPEAIPNPNPTKPIILEISAKRRKLLKILMEAARAREFSGEKYSDKMKAANKSIPLIRVTTEPKISSTPAAVTFPDLPTSGGGVG